jgi:hypothetical protein
VEKLPKSQKEYYHNKIRDYEKRTGKSMNVKGVSDHMCYDVDLSKAKLNLTAALDSLDQYFYIYHDLLVEEDIYSNGTSWDKYAYGKYKGKIHKFYYEKNVWGEEYSKDLITKHNESKRWHAKKLPATMITPPDNKHIGSDYNEFCEENNIVLKRDINWAIKMLDAGKMMTREGNRSLTLFPKKYDHAESTITTEDLFAEDWIVVQAKTFIDVLDDLYAGKTIRRKSWALEDWGVGKYANGYGRLIYSDLIADDWQVIDVVAEVDQQQKEILKDRNEH